MTHGNDKYLQLADLLLELQMAMHQADIWECVSPSDHALASQQPFCIDTMSFEQWLRFVMIERFKFMIEHSHPLPERCHISPMVEDAFRHLEPMHLRGIILVLDAIDRHLDPSR